MSKIELPEDKTLDFLECASTTPANRLSWDAIIQLCRAFRELEARLEKLEGDHTLAAVGAAPVDADGLAMHLTHTILTSVEGSREQLETDLAHAIRTFFARSGLAMNNFAAQNTNRELWRKHKDDFYSPHIFVTEVGEIGISVGGTAYIHEVELWHAHAPRVYPEPPADVGALTKDLVRDVMSLFAGDWIHAPDPKSADTVESLCVEYLNPKIAALCNERETDLRTVNNYRREQVADLRAEIERLQEKIKTLKVWVADLLREKEPKGISLVSHYPKPNDAEKGLSDE